MNTIIALPKSHCTYVCEQVLNSNLPDNSEKHHETKVLNFKKRKCPAIHVEKHINVHIFSRPNKIF